MKRAAYLIWIVIGLFIISISTPSCETDNRFLDLPPDSLPTATDTGGNMFACKVNGEVWIARNEVKQIGDYTIDGTYLKKDSLFGINARRHLYNKNFDQTINFRVVNVIDTGVYLFNRIPSMKMLVYYPEPYQEYKILDSIGLEVKITKLDTLKKIISGTFSGNLKNTIGSDTIIITDGRFDILYNHY